MMGAQGSAARLVDPANGPGTPYGGVGDEGQAGGGGRGRAQPVCPSWDNSIAITD